MKKWLLKRKVWSFIKDYINPSFDKTHGWVWSFHVEYNLPFRDPRKKYHASLMLGYEDEKFSLSVSPYNFTVQTFTDINQLPTLIDDLVKRVVDKRMMMNIDITDGQVHLYKTRVALHIMHECGLDKRLRCEHLVEGILAELDRDQYSWLNTMPFPEDGDVGHMSKALQQLRSNYLFDEKGPIHPRWLDTGPDDVDGQLLDGLGKNRFLLIQDVGDSGNYINPELFNDANEAITFIQENKLEEPFKYRLIDLDSRKDIPLQ